MGPVALGWTKAKVFTNNYIGLLTTFWRS